MGCVQFIWGIVLIGTGFANNFETLVALRVLLGVLEAPIVPGNMLIVGMWYSRRCVERKTYNLLRSTDQETESNPFARASCTQDYLFSSQVRLDMELVS